MLMSTGVTITSGRIEHTGGVPMDEGDDEDEDESVGENEGECDEPRK
jgi:hypothetical protein